MVSEDLNTMAINYARCAAKDYLAEHGKDDELCRGEIFQSEVYQIARDAYMRGFEMARQHYEGWIRELNKTVKRLKQESGKPKGNPLDDLW